MVKYNRRHRSSNVEYRGSAGRRARPNIPMRLPTSGGGKAAGGGLGIIILIAITLLSGALDGGGGGQTASTGEAPERNAFMEFIFDDVQAVWDEQFLASGLDYEFARMVIFSDSVVTDGCGSATSAVGPFYCPADSRVYLDQEFFGDLARRFGAPGDFAQAYVVAHEVGHHVQNVLGFSDRTRQLQASDPSNRNQYSINLELQADCYAGVWGNQAAEQGILEPGDIDEGIAAAGAVGDDRIQESAGGDVNPETWTHGSADQRIRAFRLGFETGDPDRCDFVQ